ncbi:Rpn family recombination-promoting nuclease/putative transposase [Rickettsia asembonensis]|uniref:Rpn family recombination-promoting nuclease/putative transposase n=1 Tax=Rickettsia asembonensis TaxID=1068590 RepID=UPI0023F87594|nr:Rpn family recombination-promoting nuclease/putative transposase [Rickettsia asembonensis]WCR55954.1 MAG: ISNCY family transposase ISSen7 [Rickettsia asembonensis]
MNDKEISNNKSSELSANNDAADAGNSSSTTYDKDTTSERPRHDALIRKAFENPIVAKEFFEMHLPKEIKAMFSSHTLKIEKESFIEADLKHSISDILFSARFKDDTGYLWVLLEHQSTPDHFMAFRLFKYMTDIAARHLTLNPKSKHLPFVYPLIFYNGKKKYNAPKNIWDLCQQKELMQDIWTKDHQVINVHDIPDEELKKKAWAGILQFFMKHIHERDLLTRWYEIADLLPEFAKLNIGIDYLELILTYTLIKIEKSDKIELEKILKSRLNNQQGEKLMTSLAHHWEQQGVEKGMQIGRNEGMQIGEAKGMQIGEAKRTIEVAQNLLAQNININTISVATGLTVDEINKLKNS